MYRLLWNLNPLDGGGQTQPTPEQGAALLAGQAPPAAPPAPPAAPPAPKIPDGHVVVPADQLQQLLSKLDTLTKTQQQAEQERTAAAQARIAKLATADVEKGYQSLQEQYQTDRKAWEERLEEETRANRSTHKSLAISQALASRTDLVEGSNVHLATILANDPNIEVVRDGDRFVVRTRTLQSIPDYLASLLQQPQNRLFLRAQAAGGTGSTQYQAGPAPVQTPAQPQTLGEQLIIDWNNRPRPSTDPRLDPTRNRLAGYN